MTRQPSVPGHRRDPLPSCVMGDIKKAVESMSKRYDVSKSWIVADALAAYFGISTHVMSSSARIGRRRK